MFDRPHRPSRAHMALKARFSPNSNVWNPFDPATSDPATDDPITSVVVVTVTPTADPTTSPANENTRTRPVKTQDPATTPVVTPTPNPATTPTTSSTQQQVTPANPATSQTAANPNTTLTPATTPTTSSTLATTATPATKSTSATAVAVTTPGKQSSAAVEGTTQYVMHTSTVSHGAAAASVSAAASPSATTSSGVSTGVLAGGISAAVLAGVGILVALFYLVRKCRTRQDNFDADDFKRKSMALPDEPSAWQPRANASAGGPRPPTMLERAMVQPSVAPSFAPAYAPQFAPQFAPQTGPSPWDQQHPPSPSPFAAYAPGAHISGYSTASFSPGEVVFSSPQSPPTTATAAQPVFFVPQAPHGHGSMDAYGHPQPLQSPPSTPGPYGSLVDNHQSPLARSSSMSSQHENEYVDLDRSSVTPFQARQYSEIHKRLDIMNVTPPPPVPVKEAPATPTIRVQEEAAADSPFADPVLPQDDGAHHEVDLTAPEPAFIQEERPRVTSQPPMLPELAARPFSHVSLGTHEYDFQLHPGGSGALSPGLSADSFPHTPLPPQTPNEESFAVQQTQAQAPAPVQTRPAPAAPAPQANRVSRRPETVYDTEDAYDGI